MPIAKAETAREELRSDGWLLDGVQSLKHDHEEETELRLLAKAAALRTCKWHGFEPETNVLKPAVHEFDLVACSGGKAFAIDFVFRPGDEDEVERAEIIDGTAIAKCFIIDLAKLPANIHEAVEYIDNEVTANEQ